MFLIHDDAQWIKGGWINRNYINVNGKPFLLTLPVAKGQSTGLINQRHFTPIGRDQDKLIRILRNAYQGSPFYPDAMPLLENSLKFHERNVNSLISYSIREICRYLGINTSIDFTSKYTINTNLTGQAKVIALCQAAKGTTYINSFGGHVLYDQEIFRCNGINLKFLKPKSSSLTFALHSKQPMSIAHDLMTDCQQTLMSRLNSYEFLNVKHIAGEEHA